MTQGKVKEGRNKGRERRKERGKEGWLDGREPLLASSLTAPLGSLARCERYSGFVPREDSRQNPGRVFPLRRSHYSNLKLSKLVPLEKQLMESRTLFLSLIFSPEAGRAK